MQFRVLNGSIRTFKQEVEYYLLEYHYYYLIYAFDVCSLCIKTGERNACMAIGSQDKQPARTLKDMM